MNGTLYGVGVGPGDPELMTIKALKRIESSPVIAVPAKEKEKSAAYKIAVKAVANLQDKEILCIEMPMTRDKEKLMTAHYAGAEELTRVLRQGKDIAFLTLGDPAVYSTYLYLDRLIRGAGFRTEMVSGVPSFCAAAALLGTGLAENAEQLHLVPSAYGAEDVLKLSGTKVLMKAGKKIPEIKKLLAGADVDVYMAENCGMEGERVYHGIDEIPDDAGYYSLFLVKDRNGLFSA